MFLIITDFISPYKYLLQVGVGDIPVDMINQ